MEQRRRIIWTLAAVLAVAFLLRLGNLGGPELWGDEVLSTTAQYLPLEVLMRETSKAQTYVAPVEPPGWHVLNRLAKPAISDPTAAIYSFGGRTALRALPALLGVLSVLMLWLIARRLVEPRAAWVPAALLAVSFYGIYYSQENRPYSAVIFFALLSTWLYHETILRGRRRLWPLYGLSLAVPGYLTYPAVMVGLIHLVAFVVVWAGRRPLPGASDTPRKIGRKEIATFAFAGLLALVLFLPWLKHSLQMAIMPQLFHPVIADGPGGKPGHVLISSLAHWGCGGWDSLAIYLPLAVLGLVAVWRRSSAYGITFASFYLVGFAYVMLSTYGHMFHPRYLIFIFPMHQLLAGLGLVELARLAAAHIGKTPAETYARKWLVLILLALALLAFRNFLPLGNYFEYQIKCSADNCPHAEFCREYIEPLWDD